MIYLLNQISKNIRDIKTHSKDNNSITNLSKTFDVFPISYHGYRFSFLRRKNMTIIVRNIMSNSIVYGNILFLHSDYISKFSKCSITRKEESI